RSSTSTRPTVRTVRSRGRRSAWANRTPNDCNRSGLIVSMFSDREAWSVMVSCSSRGSVLGVSCAVCPWTADAGCTGVTEGCCTPGESHSHMIGRARSSTATEATTPIVIPMNIYWIRDGIRNLLLSGHGSAHTLFELSEALLKLGELLLT